MPNDILDEGNNLIEEGGAEEDDTSIEEGDIFEHDNEALKEVEEIYGLDKEKADELLTLLDDGYDEDEALEILEEEIEAEI